MGVHHAAIDDTDDDAAGTSDEIPRLGGVDVRIDDAAGSTGVVECPLRWVAGVGRDGGLLESKVGFDVSERTKGRKEVQDLRVVERRVGPDEKGAAATELVKNLQIAGGGLSQGLHLGELL